MAEAGHGTGGGGGGGGANAEDHQLIRLSQLRATLERRRAAPQPDAPLSAQDSEPSEEPEREGVAPLPNPAALKKLVVAQLRVLLLARGADSAGTKAVLVERLEATRTTDAGPSLTTDAGPSLTTDAGPSLASTPLLVRELVAACGQGLTLAHFKAQLKGLRDTSGHNADVRAQLEHVLGTCTGQVGLCVGQSKLELSGKGQSTLKMSGNGNECKPLRAGCWRRGPRWWRTRRRRQGLTLVHFPAQP
jgi:hypothetical protein